MPKGQTEYVESRMGHLRQAQMSKETRSLLQVNSKIIKLLLSTAMRDKETALLFEIKSNLDALIASHMGKIRATS